ncbi:MAG: hypothetical protein HC893_02170 [Chloroflexaceae bacterium]|nr:hypothetical protein [Chloroflexaceae bacterium]NJO06987.1 hypothetical protein [Chloroflexaceae bacterium]
MPRNAGGSKPRKATSKPAKATGVSWLYQVSDWAIYEVLLSNAWDVEENIAAITVARQSPRSGKIGAASFLVDLQCLGVKSSFVRICKGPDDYVRRLREP